MGWLDALLGNVLSSGTAVDLEGTVNFSNGIEAVGNPAQGRIDVKPSAALQAMAGRAADIRILGVGSVTGGGTTTINLSDYTVLGGTYVGGSNDANIVASTTSARLTYTGTDAVRAIVLVSCRTYSAGPQNGVLTIFAAGTPQSGVDAQIDFENSHPFAKCALVTLAHNEAVDLRAVGTDLASADVVISGLSMILVVLGAV
jgi:hypothetical protein